MKRETGDARSIIPEISEKVAIEIIIDDILTDYAYANSKGKLVEARDHLIRFIRLVSSPLKFSKESTVDDKTIHEAIQKLKLAKDELRFLNQRICVERQ